MKMNLVQLIEKVAKKHNLRIDILPNGVIILVKDNFCLLYTSDAADE